MNIKRINLPLSWGRMYDTSHLAPPSLSLSLSLSLCLFLSHVRARRTRCIELTALAHIACIGRFFFVFPNEHESVTFGVHKYVPHHVEEAICSKSGRLRWDETRTRGGRRDAAPASLGSLPCLTFYPRESTTFNSHRQRTTNVKNVHLALRGEMIPILRAFGHRRFLSIWNILLSSCLQVFLSTVRRDNFITVSKSQRDFSLHSWYNDVTFDVIRKFTSMFAREIHNSRKHFLAIRSAPINYAYALEIIRCRLMINLSSYSSVYILLQHNSLFLSIYIYIYIHIHVCAYPPLRFLRETHGWSERVHIHHDWPWNHTRAKPQWYIELWNSCSSNI